MNLFLLAVMVLPLPFFLVAGVLELRSGASCARRIANLIPVVLAIAAYGLSWNPGVFLPIALSAPIMYGKVMTMVFAVIACSCAFFTYSRRGSAILVASGALFMAFVWVFFGHPIQ